MKQPTICFAPASACFVLLAVVATPGFVQALPGPAPTGTAVAHYFRDSGEVVVSVANVSNWYIQSNSLSLTGPADGVEALPLAPGSELVLDNDLRIGEFVFGGDFSYTDVDLGAVAEVDLPDDDLHVYWNSAGLGQPLLSQPVVYFQHRPDDVIEPPPPERVTGREFILWQRGASNPPLDPSALAQWEATFGQQTVGSSGVTIPEPSAGALLIAAIFAALSCRLRLPLR